MTEITYEALYNEVAVYAAALKKLGIQQGDRVVGKKSVTLLILMLSSNTKELKYVILHTRLGFPLILHIQGFFQQFWEKAPGQNWKKLST